jgi:hypothetical protein
MAKYCSKCGELKELSQFYADKRKLDGKKAECGACNRAASAKRLEDPKKRGRNRDRALKHFYLNKGASPRLAALMVEKRKRSRVCD